MLKSPCKISAAWVPGSGIAKPPLNEFEAIWDTGATNSVITQAVANDCGLTPTGIAKVHGVHGEGQAETYLVNIALPNGVEFIGIRVTKGDLGGAGILLGMDIIGMGDFSVTNCDGYTKFSYRTPSIEHIDYVLQAEKLEAERVQPSNRAERRRAKRSR